MISYNILHFERPYLLEPHINLLRKFIPNDLQIIVLDDGSRRDVLDRIKTFAIDKLLVNKEHIQTNKSTGYCSDIIEQGVKESDGDYYIFAEDDYWYCGQFLEFGVLEKRFTMNNVTPLVFFDNAKIYSGIQDSMKLLNHENILVQMSRPSYDIRAYRNADHIGKQKIRETTAWGKLSLCKKNVYNNAPFMMSLGNRRKIKLADGQSIYMVQRDCEKQIREHFNNKYAMRPPTSMFAHVGSPFTMNIPSSDRSQSFKQSVGSYIPKIMDMDFKRTLDGIKFIHLFNQHILELYLKNEFKINFTKMLQCGLNQSFVDAISEVSHTFTSL